jgi:WD40 repeat protein
MRQSIRLPALFLTMISVLCVVSGHATGQTPAPVARAPEVWAILVGIGDYKNAAIPDSQTAVRNARAVQGWMRQAGWEPHNQVLLSDSGSVDHGALAAPAANILASRNNLDWVVEHWLFQKAQPGDLVVFYYAGESRCEVKRQDTQLDVRHYLLPQDADPAEIERDGWPLENAVDQCVRKKLRVVCWLATVPQERGETVKPAAEERGWATAWSPGVAWLARWPGVTAWLASDRPRPVAAQSVGDPGNVFTQELLNALGGGKLANKPNLAACLKDLQQNQQLKNQGFGSLGGVPPSMTLWAGEKGPAPAEPRPEVVIQAGHADRVTAMAFPADGRLIMTAARDSTVRIWSVPDRSLLRVLSDQMVGVAAMALTRNDRWLITGGGRGAVWAYDRNRDFQSVPMAGAQPHKAGIRQIALLPDGLHFVSIDSDGQSFRWDPSQPSLAPKPWPANAVCREIACGGRSIPNGPDTGYVVAHCLDGTLRAIDSLGNGGLPLQLPRPDLSAIAVSPDGRWLGLGFENGLVVIRNVETQAQNEYQAAAHPAAVRRLVFSTAGLLMIGHEDGMRLVGKDRRVVDLIDHPTQDLVFSPGGEYLAACTKEIGAVRVWRIASDGSPVEVRALNDPKAEASSLGFTGNSRGLIVADVSGGLAFRPLDRHGDEAAWSFPAHRGMIQQLSATPDHRLLLFLDEQRGVRIWDLVERTCRSLNGTYRAGAFLDDNRVVLIPDSNAADHAGRLVLADRSGERANSDFFAIQSDKFLVPDGIPFERLAVSEDGRLVAAASDTSKEPMVCVWETKNGRLMHWITSRQLDDSVAAIAFSSDGRYLLTGSNGDAPTGRVWDLSAPRGQLDKPAVVLSDPEVKEEITCAAIRPGNPNRVVTGHSNGRVHGWTREPGKARLDQRPLVVRKFSTAVKSLCFTSDGQYLGAAGDGKRIWVSVMDPQPDRVTALDRLRAHHDEQINALIAWKDRPILVSGSDDTTIRFWDLKTGSLQGTFSASNRSTAGVAVPIRELDWALYTPDGHFDASAAATKLVHYRRPGAARPAGQPDRSDGRAPGQFAVGIRRLDEAGQLDQLAATHYVFGLGEDLVRGEISKEKQEVHAPAPISISVPPRTDPRKPDVRLTITLGADDFREVRLYHNDVPIPTGWDVDRKPVKAGDGSRIEVPVKLVGGENRFYVMASRTGDYDSCSRVVEVDCEAQMERGRVHVLALGVGGYQARRLGFARDDADQLSEFLGKRGFDAKGEPGLVSRLFDAEVDRESVRHSFEKIALEVEDRPQDTVVVFLAGHTGVFNPQRFCLLKTNYPFSDTEPTLVAMRDSATKNGENETADDNVVLPYSLIEAHLARLKALNRLVIVDACQAESILDDPGVRAIRKWVESASRRARTSYLLAARRGEAAAEVTPLKHGLFTYTLLRGMRAIDLQNEPKTVAALKLPVDADFDGDGTVSTDELQEYAKQVLPRLSNIFTRGNVRSGDEVVPRDASAKNAPAPAQTPPSDPPARVQATGVSFPLISLDKAPLGP